MNKTVKAWLKNLAFLVLLGGSLLLCGVVVTLILCSDMIAKRTLTSEDVAQLDVLVISGAKPHIVGGYELDSFIKDHPDSRLIVPAGQEKELNRELAINGNPLHANVQTHWRFKVVQVSDGHQSFEVIVDGKNRTTSSWYEARGQQIIPKYTKQCGIGQAMQAIPYGAGLCILFSAAIFFIRQKLHQADNSEP